MRSFSVSRLNRALIPVVLVLSLLSSGMAFFPHTAAGKSLPDPEPPLPPADGTMDHALIPLSDLWTSARGAEVTVVVEFEDPPLAVEYARKKGDLSASSQQRINARLLSAQAPVVRYLQDHAGKVLSQYTRAYNGLLVQLPYQKIPALEARPDVKAVHRAPSHVPILDNSVPTIRADEVTANFGYEGDGISIGIIDSGIDYTHAALGGSGDPDDYTNNDPTTLADGGFPNTKVVGGYDFAGSNYTGAGSTPEPDPDPLDEYSSGHGTHVASTAAGLEVPYRVAKGVAPKADLYALKVFGPEGSTNLTADAIEWALDPNGDGNLSDHLDVINLSLGNIYGPAAPDDPVVIAVQNAVDAGVVVVAAAGNEGNTPYITGTPASASGAISVAASNAGYEDWTTAEIPSASETAAYAPSDFDNQTGHFADEISAPLYDVSQATASTLCSTDGLAPDLLSGDVALIERGSCNYSVKVNNAASLGAAAVLVYNNTAGRETMSGDPVSIPAGMISQADGATFLTAHGETVNISPETQNQAIAENIKGFSSRGPRGFDSHLKPEITAPGYPIYAAWMGTGTQTIGFQGTSMASPHVAGAAALVLEAHPTWTPAEVKAALMNRAVDLDDGAPVPRAGVGRVDAYRSVSTEVVALGDPDLISLSWGFLPLGSSSYSDMKDVTFHSDAASAITYDISWSFDSASLTSGVDFTHPASVTVPAGGTETISVQLDLDATQVPSSLATLEEYSGYFTFTNNADSSDVLRLPFYLTPRPYSQLSEGTTDLNMSFYGDQASIEVTGTGPIASDLTGYPLLGTDPNEGDIDDEGDLQYLGLDYGGLRDTDGNGTPDTDTIVVAFNTYGSWHTPQPFFAEFNLFLDIDEDGEDDYLLYNSSLKSHNDSGSWDDWVVVKRDLSSDTESLAGPFPIETDYNTGAMVWILPISGSYGFGLDPVGSGGNTTFDFTVKSYDFEGREDPGPSGRFDAARPPFAWSLDSATTYTLSIDDPLGYNYSRPEGFLLLDWQGQPGEGQGYAWALEVEDSRQDTADFDGSGNTDISVYRPSNGNWYIKDQGFIPWGFTGDLPVPGDYNGDEEVDIAVYRPSNGNWYIKDQGIIPWGYADDVPLPCDYDGDGTDEIAVYRPANGNWYVKNQGRISWGKTGDIPVPGDYDGNGSCDIAVYRPANGKWYIKDQGPISWGRSDDIPVPGDYDGDGSMEAAVYRPTNGNWYIMGQAYTSWGMTDDIPVPGDYDGDGDTDIGVLRPSNGKWYLKGIDTVKWYASGDFPLPVRDTNADGDPHE